MSMKDPVNGMEMVFVNVPGGSYDMGCGAWADNCRDDEKLHPVQVAEFWIGQMEVTRKQWRQVMGGATSLSKQDENLPVDNISWNDVQEFIKKIEKISQTESHSQLIPNPVPEQNHRHIEK